MHRVTDKDDKEPLHEAIEQELQVGMGGLPKWFGKYFDKVNKEIKTHSIQHQKLWLVGVRKGRLCYDQDNIIQDEFTYTGVFKTWLGL